MLMNLLNNGLNIYVKIEDREENVRIQTKYAVILFVSFTIKSSSSS